MPTALTLLLAAAPVIALLILLALRVPTVWAALAGIGLIVALSFKFTLGVSELGTLAERMIGILPSVTLIMFGGIVLAEMLSQSGAHDRISSWLNQAAGNRVRAVLLIGFTVVPMIESVIGWGVGIVVGVPLLMRAGLTPMRAAIAALLGMTHNAWGSLGLSLLLVEGMSGVALQQLGVWVAVFTLPVLLIQGTALLMVSMPRPWRFGAFAQMLVVAFSMWLALLATNMWITPALAGVLSPITGMVVLLLLSRRSAPLPAVTKATLLAVTPYALLIVLMLLAFGLSSLVHDASLRSLATSPALWLMVTAACTPLIVRLRPRQVRTVLGRASRMWAHAFTVTVLFILFGMMLSVNGMSDALAAAGTELGAGFVWLVPAAGALAGYLTVSNLSAASIVAPGTTFAANMLGVPTEVLLGAQNTMSSTAILASPARVVLATTLATQLARADDESIDSARVTKIVLAVTVIGVALVTTGLAVVLFSG